MLNKENLNAIKYKYGSILSISHLAIKHNKGVYPQQNCRVKEEDGRMLQCSLMLLLHITGLLHTIREAAFGNPVLL